MNKSLTSKEKSVTARDLSSIYSSSNRPYPTYLCSDLVGKGDPHKIISAQTSITGRHGSGKTLLFVSHMFTEKKTTYIVNSDEQFKAYNQSHRYQERSGIITDLDHKENSVEVRDLLDPQSSLTVKVLSTLKDLKVGDQVKYFIWSSEFLNKTYQILNKF